MSTITKKWSVEKIREVLSKLDEKTSLDASSLNIVFDELDSSINPDEVLAYYKPIKKEKKLLCYYNPIKREFAFDKKFFNNHRTKEAAVIDAIRHEYAHFYSEEMNIKSYIKDLNNDSNHNEDWKWSCKMINANPEEEYKPYSYRKSILNNEEVEALCNANDVLECDINSYISKWKHLPVTPEVGKRCIDYIKENNPNSYYEVDDEVLHPQYGFGRVIETVPHSFLTQVMLVEFEDKNREVFEAEDLLKIIDGCAYPYRAIANFVEKEEMYSRTIL